MANAIFNLILYPVFEGFRAECQLLESHWGCRWSWPAVSATGASRVSVPPTGIGGGLGCHSLGGAQCLSQKPATGGTGLSEESEGLSTSSWSRPCAWCWGSLERNCLYLLQTRCSCVVHQYTSSWTCQWVGGVGSGMRQSGGSKVYAR